jgi:aspartate-semialdehyde dehydrogenase
MDKSMTPVNIAIAGGESLIGRELREVLKESARPLNVKLLGVDEEAGTLTEQEGEATIITALDEDDLRRARVVFLAGSAASSRKALAVIEKTAPRPDVIDLTYATEDNPVARLRAPVIEKPGYRSPPETLHVIAHPAAIALALFMTRLRERYAIRRSIVHIFEPASERGQRGLDELQKQTVNLFSFQNLPKDVFDAQLSFNLLSRYGSDAPQSLDEIELRIEHHLATLLSGAGDTLLPSTRLIQAPVFHGYSMSAHIEFEEKPDLSLITEHLASHQVDVRHGELEAPSNVGIAGQGGIAVGSISADRNDPMACWFWIVTDNFHLMAENAVAVMQGLLLEDGARTR